MTPLHYAVNQNLHKVIASLLRDDRKCDLNARNKEGYTPLMLACVKNSKNALEALFQRRDDLDLTLCDDKDGNNFFHFLTNCDETMIDKFIVAQKGGNVETREKWLKRVEAALNASNKRGVTPIQQLVENGPLAELRRFKALFEGIEGERILNPNEPTNQGISMNPQIFSDFKETVKKANPYLLLSAAGVGDEKVLQFLSTELGIEVVSERVRKIRINTDRQERSNENDDEKSDGETALHVAAKYNKRTFVLELVKLCHSKDDLPEFLMGKDKKGMTPLLHAAHTGAWDAAEVLISEIRETGKYSDTKLFFHHNDSNENMLILAKNNKHPDFIENLLKTLIVDDLEYANTFWEAQKSETSMAKNLLYSIVGCGSVEGLKKILDKGDEKDFDDRKRGIQKMISTRDENDETVLHVAIRKGHLSVVKYLLQTPNVALALIINEVDSQKNTALHLAAQDGHEEICTELLRKGVKTHLVNKDDMTPFDLAISCGQLECVEALAKHYKIDGGDVDKMKPLHYAARGGHEKIVKYLLDVTKDKPGATIDKTCWIKGKDNNWEEKTALDIALDGKKIKVAEILLKHRDWKKLLRRAKYFPEEQEELETPMRRLIKKFPSLAKQVMDQCKEAVPRSKKHFNYNFEFIDDTFMFPKKDGSYSLSNEKGEELVPNEYLHPDAKCYTKDKIKIREFHPLRLMADSEHKETRELLEHELVKVMLDYRWNTYGKRGYYICSLLPYISFLIAYIGLFCLMDGENIHPNHNNSTHQNGLRSMNSFDTTCAITTSTDGSEDGLIHCFKKDGPIPEGAKQLADARIERAISGINNHLSSIELEEDIVVHRNVHTNNGHLLDRFVTCFCLLVVQSAYVAKENKDIWTIHLDVPQSLPIVYSIDGHLCSLHHGFLFQFLSADSKRGVLNSHILFPQNPHDVHGRDRLFGEALRITAMVIFPVFVMLIVVLLSNLFTGVAVGDIETIRRETEITEIAVRPQEKQEKEVIDSFPEEKEEIDSSPEKHFTTTQNMVKNLQLQVKTLNNELSEQRETMKKMYSLLEKLVDLKPLTPNAQPNDGTQEAKGDPQQSVEQQPVEQQPVEQQPVEQQPVEQQPVEQQPGQQQPGQQQPGQQQPPTPNAQPNEQQPGQQQPGQQQPPTPNAQPNGGTQEAKGEPQQPRQQQPEKQQPGNQGEQQPVEQQPGQDDPASQGEPFDLSLPVKLNEDELIKSERDLKGRENEQDQSEKAKLARENMYPNISQPKELLNLLSTQKAFESTLNPESF
ncbi:unnamed protein product, partial [Mesorhabditis belari]|uniref:Uncharacterized protein n=1 Tax=Mesorhabditis belari TaxID=2138241 RepID=A0AAF3FPJ0_9BILA